MPNQVNAWSLLVAGDIGGALGIISLMPSCVHVNGWAYVDGKRRGIVAVPSSSSSPASSSQPAAAAAALSTTSTASGAAASEEGDPSSPTGDYEGGEKDSVASTSAPPQQQQQQQTQQRFSSFSIGANNAFAAPLLFYAIALQQVDAVRSLLRIGAPISISIKGGVTALGMAQWYLERARKRSDERTLNKKKGQQQQQHNRSADNLNSTTTITAATSSSSVESAEAILSLVQRYIAREANPLSTIVSDEEEARVYTIEAEEAAARRVIEERRDGGMITMVCEIRDDVGGYALPPPNISYGVGAGGQKQQSPSTTNLLAASTSGGGGAFGGVSVISGTFSSTSGVMNTYNNTPSATSLSGGGYTTSTTAMGREVITFLFPRFGSYGTLRSRVENICGCRVGIAYDKIALEKLTNLHREQVLGVGRSNMSMNGSAHHALHTTTSNTSAMSRSAAGIGGGNRSTSSMSNNNTNNKSRANSSMSNGNATVTKRGGNANTSRHNTTAALNRSLPTNLSVSASSAAQWKTYSTELTTNNFSLFIKQADMLNALYTKAKEERRAAREEAAASRARIGDDDGDEEEDEEDDDYFIPPLHVIVRPVPYAAAGNEADAEHYALVKNKTRIAKELKAYEALPPTERSLVRVQALKKQADDEEREFLTKQNFVQFHAAKTLSAEALEATTKRLYDYPMQKMREKNEAFDYDVEVQMEKMMGTRYNDGELSAEQQESVDRLHYNAVEREERLQEIDEERWANIPHAPECELDEEEVMAIRERLYTDTREQTRQQLEEKYYGDQDARWGRTISKEAVQKSVESCYTKPLEKKKAEMAKLEAKYGDWMLRKKQFKANPIRKYAAK